MNIQRIITTVATTGIVLILAMCPDRDAIAQDRQFFDDGFDPSKGVLFEASSPGALHKVASPDGRFRAETEFQKVRVWTLADNQLLHEFNTSGISFSPTFSPDGSSLVVAVCRGNLGCISTLHAWNLDTGKHTRLGECSGMVLDMQFSQTGKHLAVVTYYGPIFSVVLSSKHNKKWYGGELVVLNTESPESAVRIFCELSGIPEYNEDSAKGRDPNDVATEMYKHLDDANRRCLPVRVGLTADGSKVTAVTSTGVVRVFDARTGKPELSLSSTGRVGSEIISSAAAMTKGNRQSPQPQP